MNTPKTATVKDWLRGVTHKPGWHIAYAGEVDGEPFITICAVERDSNNPGLEFTTSPLWRVPNDIDNRDQFLDWILDVCIPGIETHERWEWFRVDGRKHRDPHASGMAAYAIDFDDAHLAG